jgi:hypothetical protein
MRTAQNDVRIRESLWPLGRHFVRTRKCPLAGVKWTSADRQLRRIICLTFLWRRQRQGLVKYSFDQRVFRQVFMVLSYDRFCFL